MKAHLFPAIKLTLVCLILFSGIYTVVLLGIAQFAPNNGNGEVITYGDKTFHVNVAQNFSDDKYFWSRPSAVGYNAAGSGGSNKGPTNPDYLATVQARIDTFLVHNPGVNKNEIPADLVTASGSGIDPHISIQAAKVQVKRVARVRNIDDETLYQLIAEHTQKPLLGLFGTETLNVLKLNLALDQIK